MATLKLYNRKPRSEEEARGRAMILMAHMMNHMGGKWSYRVWLDSCYGWRYTVHIGTLELEYYEGTHTFVCVSVDKIYSVIKKVGRSEASMIWKTPRGSHDPVAVVEQQMAMMEEAVLKLVDLMNSNRAKLGKPIYKIKGIYSNADPNKNRVPVN